MTHRVREAASNALAAGVIAAIAGALAAGAVEIVREPCRPNANFVADVNVPDGTVEVAGDPFTKKWQLENPVGERRCAWNAEYNIVWSGGPRLGDKSAFSVPSAQPGDKVTVEADLVAPTKAGTYLSYWSLRNPDGYRFGDPFWVQISVK